MVNCYVIYKYSHSYRYIWMCFFHRVGCILQTLFWHARCSQITFLHHVWGTLEWTLFLSASSGDSWGRETSDQCRRGGSGRPGGDQGWRQNPSRPSDHLLQRLQGRESASDVDIKRKISDLRSTYSLIKKPERTSSLLYLLSVLLRWITHLSPESQNLKPVLQSLLIKTLWRPETSASSPPTVLKVSPSFIHNNECGNLFIHSNDQLFVF